MCYQKGDEFNKTDVEKVQTTKQLFKKNVTSYMSYRPYK